MKKIFLVLALGIAGTAFSQKVNNTLKFKKGQKFQVVVETNKTSSVEMMGQSIDTKVVSTITQLLDVQDVNSEGATIAQTVKQIKFDMTNPMQSQSFDSDKEEDRNGQIGQMIENTLDNAYIMTVDRTGVVKSVKAEEDKSRGDGQDMGDLMTAQLGVDLSTPQVGQASSFKILPDHAVAVNDSWTDSASADGQKRKTVYTMKNITPDEIVIGFTENLDINTTQKIMGVMEATINTSDKTKGTITLDRKTGLLKQRTGTMTEEGTMEAQGQKIPIKGTTEIKVTVKPAE